MVYTLGESLLDIIFTDTGQITARAGGSVLNTSVSLGRCGIDVSLISELGDDTTAELILRFLKENNVDTGFVKKYYHQTTSVAVAHLNKLKIPSFSIYKTYPTQRRLIPPNNFQKGDILVFGSLYSLDTTIRNEIIEIILKAKNEGALVCYDPNIRKHNLDEPLLKQAITENFAFADIIKGSEEDLMNIFGEKNYEEYYAKIAKIKPDAIFILTLGKEGVIGYKTDKIVKLPAKRIDVISTIGAGDAFNAGIIYYLEKLKDKKAWFDNVSPDLFEKMLQSGLQFSAEVCESIYNYISKAPPD